jgi:uncharacterized protein DUF5916/cellulose/xylan binding protein with CBM9 domain
MKLTVLCLSCAVGLPLTAAASPQDFDLETVRASKRVAAVRISEPIVVDGTLDEAAWALAEPAGDFYQQFPDEFGPASERSEVRFLYDDEMLYIGAMMYDREPDRLIIDSLRRDFSNFQSDSFLLVFDTFLDRRNGYGFNTNAGGAQRDTQSSDNGRRNDVNWNGAWFSRSSVLENGWSTEIAVPFKTLRFPPGDLQQWGLQMQRVIRRKNEFATWSPVPRQFSHYAVGYAGLLTGITGIESGGSDLRITPFTTGQFKTGPAGTRAWDADGDAGVDLKWGVTSSLLLDASYRTDFSQVEADEQQINLTRFSLFFPEKRQFFLESPASFQVGLSAVETQRRDLVPFFSRRIGLSASGQPIPVIGGLRLTGRAAGNGIGLLTMQTDELEGDRGANFTVARVRRDLTNTAAIGGFYFGRETTDSRSFNRVSGVDMRLAPRPALEIEAFAMRSETDGVAGDWAGRTSFLVDTNAHRGRMGLVHIGDAFRHDLGFVRRRGIATLFGSYERVFRPADTGAFMREHVFGVDFDATGDDRYDRSLTRVGGLTYGLQFRDGGNLNARVNSTYERLDAPFTVGPDLRIEAGEHAFDNVAIEYRSDQSARLSGSVGMEAGEYWTGSQRVASGGVRLRLNEHVAASASVTRNVIDLPQGMFAANLAQFRLDWSFSPRMFLNAFVQYNGEADAWLSNIRFNLIHRPLSDIYVVWNESRLPGDTRRALMLKYTHLIAF